jgi:hypothetical protein
MFFDRTLLKKSLFLLLLRNGSDIRGIVSEFLFEVDAHEVDQDSTPSDCSAWVPPISTGSGL